jgi:hypothetical protein
VTEFPEVFSEKATSSLVIGTNAPSGNILWNFTNDDIWDVNLWQFFRLVPGANQDKAINFSPSVEFANLLNFLLAVATDLQQDPSTLSAKVVSELHNGVDENERPVVGCAEQSDMTQLRRSGTKPFKGVAQFAGNFPNSPPRFLTHKNTVPPSGQSG